jgi:hypothetical protein
MNPHRTEATVRRARELLLTRTELAPGSCLRWTGAHNDEGYPYVRHDGRMVGTHRLVYDALVADLAPGAPVHHTCAVRDCINPAHLQRASTAANTLDALGRVGLSARIAELEELRAVTAWRCQALEAALHSLDPTHPLLVEANP